MKKKHFLLMTLLVGLISNSGVAQWTPNPATTTDNISRTGNVSLGSLSTVSTTPKLNVEALVGSDGFGNQIGHAARFKLATVGSAHLTLDLCRYYMGTTDHYIKASHSTYGSVFSVLSTGNTTIGNSSSTGTMFSVLGGNVIIGNVSANTNYKLFVETGILTEKVKVAVKNTSNWSDYVFDTNYKLWSLEEVEFYIQKNKHLPGVPSAEEVVQEGIDVATMDAKLLEKIEELTLYMIEMKKENEALKLKMEALEKMVNN